MSVALVTGGSRGVGRVIALTLARAGIDVAVTSRTAAEVERTTSELAAYGARALGRQADTTDATSVDRLVEAVEEELGPVDVLFNNAGTARALGPFWELDPDECWGDIASTLRSAFVCTRRMVPGMIERGGGLVVNVSSYVGARPAPYQASYGAAKAAVASFGESLAAELAPQGVRVVTISPGLFRTAMVSNILDSPAGQRWLPRVGEGRFVEQQRIEELVRFVVSDASEPFNGRFLHALDDLDDLVRRAEEIERDDLLTVRLRRLPAT
jgi:3-oxoacyl-[acyl-carrier protein] reductase